MTSYSESVSREDRDGVAILWVDNPPVNALSHHVREGLDAGVRAVFEDPSIVAMVLACKGRTFIAGADIREFGQPPKGVQTNAVRERFESGAKPVVAAIHGTALGGGLEMALVCHLRVAEKSARLGLPEVKLGLLPGGGGTQRLPRLVGVPRALEMITSGRHVGASEAKEIGLVDRVVESDVVDAAVEVARGAAASPEPPPRVRDRTADLGGEGPADQIFADFRRKIARKTRGFVAPENCIKAIEAAVALPFDQGLERERELFQELVTGLQSKAQRYAFFAERAARKVEGVRADTPRRTIGRVGVLGAGTMGGGIAMSFANAGVPVTIVEAEQSRLDHGLGVMRSNYERSAKAGRFTDEQVEERMGSISGSLDKAAFADVDMVVEAVFENMDLKKSIFGELDSICGPQTILATRTPPTSTSTRSPR